MHQYRYNQYCFEQEQQKRQELNLKFGQDHYWFLPHGGTVPDLPRLGSLTNEKISAEYIFLWPTNRAKNEPTHYPRQNIQKYFPF